MKKQVVGRLLRGLVLMMFTMIVFTGMSIDVYSQEQEKEYKTVKHLIKEVKKAGKGENKEALLEKLSKRAPKTKGEIEMLLDMADDEDEKVQKAVYKSLKKFNNPTHAGVFAKRIKRGKYRDRDIAISKVAEFKYKPAVPDLIDLVEEYKPNDNEEYYGLKAAYALGDIGDERAIPVLLSKLGKMRDEEQLIIAKFGKKVLYQLDEIGKNTKDPEIRRAAGNALGSINDKEAIPDLWRLVQKNPKKSNAYIWALLNVVNETTSPTFKEVEEFIFKHKEIFQSYIFMKAKKNKDIDYFLNLIQDKNIDDGYRTSAMIYLSDLKAQEAIPVLEEILKTERQKSIRSRAATALQKITGKKYEWRRNKK